MRNELMERLGIEVPILQAPMAGVGTPALAAAVSNAGALGGLGVGAMTPDAARAAIRETRRLTDGPFNVNVFCHAPPSPDRQCDAEWLAYLAYFFAEFGATPPTELREIYRSFREDEAMLAVLLEERPAVVSFHFGLPPARFIDVLRAAGIILLASATNLDEARQIAHAGIDAVVAQGIEAGGHRGVFDPEARDEGIGTFALTRLLARELSPLPMIAAGGIMDGAGIAAALALGAQAAQLGTAFVCCPESLADDAYRAALLDPARAAHTVLTSAVSGRPARGLFNRLTAVEDDPFHPSIPDYPLAYDAGKQLHAAAWAKGSHAFAAHWAGQGAPLCRALPASELVALLREEWAAAGPAAQIRQTGRIL